MASEFIAPVRSTQGRLEFLDVIRGLAALAVFLQHGIERIQHGVPDFSLSYLNLGETGVVAFFLVSGFIIPVSLEKYGSLRRFWTGRLLRLWPMYLLSLGAAIGLSAVGLRQLPELFQTKPLVFTLENASMFQELFRVPFAIGVYWTLSVEMVFYIACSALFFVGLLRKTEMLLWGSLAALLVTQVGTAVLLHRSLPAGRLGLLVTAVFGTLLYRRMNDRFSLRTLAPVLSIFGVFVVVFWLRFGVDEALRHGSDLPRPGTLCTVLSWACGYALALFFYARRSARFPRVLTWAGRISYSLYLLHVLVLDVIPPTIPGPIYLVLTLGITLALAHCTYSSIEKPLNDFQHRVLLGPRPAPARLAVVKEAAN